MTNDSRRNFIENLLKGTAGIVVGTTLLNSCSSSDPDEDVMLPPPPMGGGNPTSTNFQTVDQKGAINNEFLIESLVIVESRPNRTYEVIRHFPHTSNTSPIGSIDAIEGLSEIPLEEGDVVVSVLGQRVASQTVQEGETATASGTDGIASDTADKEFDYIHVDFILRPEGENYTVNGQPLEPNAMFKVDTELTYESNPASIFVVNGNQEHYKLTGGEFTLTAVEGTESLAMADESNPVNSTTFIVNQDIFTEASDGTLIQDHSNTNDTSKQFQNFADFITQRFGQGATFNAYITRTILDNDSPIQGRGFYGLSNPRP